MSKRHRTIRGWARIRRRILDRDGWRCSTCGRAARLEVDHRIPLEAGGHPTDPGNLQVLCTACHIAKTRAENRARRPVPPEVEAWHQLVEELL